VIRPRVKTANRGSSAVSRFFTIEFSPPFTITSTTRRKMAVTMTTPSMVLMLRGFEPRAQNLGSRIFGEEVLSGHMGLIHFRFAIGRSLHVIKGNPTRFRSLRYLKKVI